MASTGRVLRRAAALGAVLALTLLPTPAAAATTVAFTIRDPRITESSGLATDRDQDLYWTVNDSGSEGTVYGLTPSGNVRGLIGFRAKPLDVEAVAMSGRRLYVADIGDNAARRRFVTVYYFDNPSPDNETVPYRAYDFSYPDGAHDAETLLVNGDGRLYIVTKGLTGGVYAAPTNPSRQGVNRLTKVASAPAFVTDGVFLPGGKRIALRTYVSVEVLDAGSYKTVAREATPYLRQGESVTTTLDGKALLIGSEGKSSPVLQVPIPTDVGDSPSASAKPPASAAATPTPSASADPEDEPDTEDTSPAASRTGTLLALGLAALVALVAGAVTGISRRR